MPDFAAHGRRARLTLNVVCVTLVLTLVGLAGCQTPPGARPGRKPLTRDLLDGRGVDFDGSYARGMTWLDDGRHYLHRREGRLIRVDALTDVAEPAYDQDALEAALRSHEDFDEAAAKRLARQPTEWTKDRTAVQLQHQDGLYFYRFSDGQLKRIGADTQPRRVVDLAPNGRFVAFVRDNNLFTVDTDTGAQQPLTHDGSDTLLNGVLDWVYQEEIYGRGQWRAFWWRDDAEVLAYLQLDEAQVPVYTLVDYMPLHSTIEQTRYPKAGDPLPTVRIGLVRPTSAETLWADLSKYDGTDILLVRVSWAPDGRLILSVQDREQRWLDLDEVEPETGALRTLLRETSPAWTDNLAHPRWLPDGSFLWLSDRTGYRHIYHYTRDGQFLQPVTGGNWAVGSIVGCDADAGWVYFTGARETVLEAHAYRVPLAGGEAQRLTEPGFDHRVEFDPQCRFFFDTFSNAGTPTQVHLRRHDGARVRVVSENTVAALAEYAWSVPELLQIPNRDGLPMNVQLIRPPNFNARKKYPVLCPIYGGPDAPVVRNRWGGNRQLLYQYLAQQGYLIWRCDPHSATGGVAQAAWRAYRRLGVTELADLEDSLQWLIRQGYADPERIGIMGHSYGGYMAAYALTHSRMFRMGIAGAMLSDWRNYDAVYVERYMQTPAHNPEGYDAASVAQAAARLHGRLLIVHGLLDDNVHFQNAAQVIDALQEHGRMFDLMVYPRDRHGIGRGRPHYGELELQYIRAHL